MIIFCIFLVLINLILFINHRMSIYLKIDGTNSYIEIKSCFFKIKKIGKVSTKKKSKYNTNKRKTKDTKKTKLIKSKSLKLLFRILKIGKVKKLIIYEKIGLLEPSVTALVLPVVSTITAFSIKSLNIDYNNFNYKIEPYYSELKFNLLIDSQISFNIITIIISIIKDKFAQINSKIRR